MVVVDDVLTNLCGLPDEGQEVGHGGAGVDDVFDQQAVLSLQSAQVDPRHLRCGGGVV